MTDPVAPWMHDRPIRNFSPGDLRPRTSAPPWPGQHGVDLAPGGPFAMFVTAPEGWAALGLWCLDARYLRGLRTAREMVAVFAPESENDTESYAASVAAKVGAGELDLGDTATLEALCRAIAHYEESHSVWTDVEIVSGMRLCVAHWPSYRAARLAPVAEPPSEADALNQRELDKMRPT